MLRVSNVARLGSSRRAEQQQQQQQQQQQHGRRQQQRQQLRQAGKATSISFCICFCCAFCALVSLGAATPDGLNVFSETMWALPSGPIVSVSSNPIPPCAARASTRQDVPGRGVASRTGWVCPAYSAPCARRKPELRRRACPAVRRQHSKRNIHLRALEHGRVHVQRDAEAAAPAAALLDRAEAHGNDFLSSQGNDDFLVAITAPASASPCTHPETPRTRQHALRPWSSASKPLRSAAAPARRVRTFSPALAALAALAVHGCPQQREKAETEHERRSAHRRCLSPARAPPPPTRRRTSEVLRVTNLRKLGFVESSSRKTTPPEGRDMRMHER